MSLDNIDVNELIKLSETARADKDKKIKDKYNDAYNEAISHMLTDVASKMHDSAINGYNKTIIYQFKYQEDSSSDEDEFGNKIKFNGIWLLDMITKGYETFFELINERMNQNLETPKFYSYYSKKNPDGLYRIFVSWSQKVKNTEEKKQEEKKPIKKTKQKK